MSQEPKDAVAALERLVNRHHVLTREEALRVGRVLTGDAAFDLAPPAPAKAPAQPAAAQPEPETAAPDESAAKPADEPHGPAP